MTPLISLTAEEILDLIFEKAIQKENCYIYSSTSFLTFCSLLEKKLKGSEYVQSEIP